MGSEASGIELEQRRRLKDDYEFYARNCLQIKTKSGSITSFELNKAQRYIHDRIEQQRRETGKVRAIILKGRQQGCSTYVEGRFMWRVTHSPGAQVFILTHEDEATKNLFDMAKRYYENLPVFVQPSISNSNDKSLRFDRLDSSYRVGTAGNKAVGRSMTNQFIHGSEVAFWPNASEHAKGILQTVSDGENTEIIKESTANGLGNYFHQQWKLAESGQSDYIAIFVPWFWQEEYARPVRADFVPTEEEMLLVQAYGLSHEQLNWRRNKIIELSADGIDGVKAFRQEYPCNAQEAFQNTGEDGLITADVVMKARNEHVVPAGPLIVGVDPSRGGDRFSVARRRTRHMSCIESYTGEINLGRAVSICKTILDTEHPDMMFIDAGGGAELVDRLHELGYENNVKAIAFGARALNDQKYPNRRSEMWGEMNLWLRDENMPVQVEDSDSLQADLCASPYKRDSNDRICLLRKEEIKKVYGFSPDEGDACALTFAEPVRSRDYRHSRPNVKSNSRSANRLTGVR